MMGTMTQIESLIYDGWEFCIDADYVEADLCMYRIIATNDSPQRSVTVIEAGLQSAFDAVYRQIMSGQYDNKVVKDDNALGMEWWLDREIPLIQQQPQTQRSLQDQLGLMAALANRLGFYDAADFIRDKLDVSEQGDA